MANGKTKVKETEEIQTENLYKGWVVPHLNEEEWLEWNVSKKLPFEVLENEYVIFKPDNLTDTKVFCLEDGKFRKVSQGCIKTHKDTSPVTLIDTPDDVPVAIATGRGKSKEVSAKKTSKTKASKGKNILITPRNAEQICAIDLLQDPTKTIKLITGTWGTGKTMLLVNAGLEALASGRFERIVWIRNNVDVKDTKDLGALPGDVIQKLLPYLGPFRDHAGEAGTRAMLIHESLVVEPLQSLRGRNFENTLIMCSEAENLTNKHIQLIIARAAQGSEVWFDGDWRQADRDVFKKSQGLQKMIKKFKGNKLFGYVHLVKSERSATAAMADLLDEYE